MGEITAGETYSDYTFDDNAKAQDFKEVVIVIYEKVIKDNMQNEEFYRDSGFSTSDIIGTVAAHDHSTHLCEPNRNTHKVIWHVSFLCSPHQYRRFCIPNLRLKFPD
jgi:hypothetical protein